MPIVQDWFSRFGGGLPRSDWPGLDMRSLLLLFALCAGCSWQPPAVPASPAEVSRPMPVAPPQTTAVDARAVVAATVAQQQLGVDYRYGGAGPGGFDCSGLVHYAYQQAGVAVPRTTAGLWRRARDIGNAAPRPGDVLFFDFDGKPSHVGIYVGDNYFVHAPATGKTVTTVHMSDRFYAGRLRRVGRLIR